MNVFRRRAVSSQIVSIVIVIVTTVGIYLASALFFRIRQIEVIGHNVTVTVEEDILEKNLLFFPTSVLKKKLLSDNALLSDVLISKKLPHTLVIEPVIRRPIAQLVSGPRRVLLDKDGIIIGNVTGENSLPVLLFETPSVPIGTKVIDKRVLTALEFLSQYDNVLDIRLIESYQDMSIVLKHEKMDIYITQNANISLTMATLQTLLTGFRIRGTLPTTVDLRFSKPVVTF